MLEDHFQFAPLATPIPALPVPAGDRYAWAEGSTYIARPPFLAALQVLPTASLSAPATGELYALGIRPTSGDDEGYIFKINTSTGQILGEYRTISDGTTCTESSRTTVGTTAMRATP